MKSKLLVSVLVLAAIVTGFFIGQWQTKRTVDSYMTKLMSPEVRRATADFSRAAGLIQQIHRGDTNAALDALGGGTLFEPTRMDLSQGNLTPTGNPLDVAIEGDGFFQLETPKDMKGDKLLTRAGNFARDTQGRLVLATSGAAVLGDDGLAITLPDDPQKIRIDRDGTIFNGDDQIARLAVVMPDDVRNLQKEGRDAIRLVGGRTKAAPAETTVLQNTLEESTVDAVLALADLIKVSRGIEFSTRLMQTHDHMTGRLIETFGRFA